MRDTGVWAIYSHLRRIYVPRTITACVLGISISQQSVTRASSSQLSIPATVCFNGRNLFAGGSYFCSYLCPQLRLGCSSHTNRFWKNWFQTITSMQYILKELCSIVVWSRLLAEKRSDEAFFLFILWKPLFTGGLLLLSSFSLSLEESYYSADSTAFRTKCISMVYQLITTVDVTLFSLMVPWCCIWKIDWVSITV